MEGNEVFYDLLQTEKTDVGEKVSAEQVQQTIIHLRNLDSFKKAEVAEILMPNEVVIKGNIPNFLARQFN